MTFVWLDVDDPDASDTASAGMDERALEELRWYLEDYPRAPHGWLADRAALVQKQIGAWAHDLGSHYVPAGSSASGAAASAGAGDVDLLIRSDRRDRLALPWELMAGAGDRRAISERSIVRVGSTTWNQQCVDAGELRVLVVVARPDSIGDVRYRSVVEPLARWLADARVTFTVLRPPTAEQLHAVLKRATEIGRPFHIVHFDGHGAIAPGDGEVALLFEDARHRAVRVGWEALSRSLHAGAVRLCVLSACNSGTVGRTAEAALAQRLVAGPTVAVVAMAYAVSVSAAVAFSETLYESLTRGQSVSRAVARGRARLFGEPLRANPSAPNGAIDLSDWMIPTHYASHDLSFVVDDAREADRGLSRAATFVGRDREVLRMDRMAVAGHPIALHGIAGAGKSALAREATEWWRATRLASDVQIVWADLAKQPDDLNGSFDDAADEPAGEPDERDSLVVLVVDHVDCAPEHERLVERHLVGLRERGDVLVILISRRRLEWVPGDRHLEVGELSRVESLALAASFGEGRSRDDDAGEAVDRRAAITWAGGIPATLVDVAERLRRADPSAVLRDLHDGDAEPSTEKRVHAIAPASVLQGVAEPEVLQLMCQALGDPQTDEDHSEEAWTARLEAAADAGLALRLADGAYRLHPAFGARQRSAGRREELAVAAVLAYATIADDLIDDLEGPQAGAADRFVETHETPMVFALRVALENCEWESAQALLQALDAHWQRRGRLEEVDVWLQRAMAVAATDEPDLASKRGALWLYIAGRYAQRHRRRGLLSAAIKSYEDICRVLDANDRSTERDRRLLIAHLQLGSLRGERRDDDDALIALDRAREIAESLDDDRARAAALHERGALRRRQGAADAQSTLERALELASACGDVDAAARAEYELGILATKSRDLDRARTLFVSNLARETTIGDLDRLSGTYHALGMVEAYAQNYAEATKLFLSSLEIKERLGDLPGMASSNHELGAVSRKAGRLDEAEGWFRKSLAIEESLDSLPGRMSSYGALSILAAFDRKDADTGITWAIRALTVVDEFPHPLTEPSAELLAILARDHGLDAIERSWPDVTGNPLPSTIYDWLKVRIAQFGESKEV